LSLNLEKEVFFRSPKLAPRFKETSLRAHYGNHSDRKPADGPIRENYDPRLYPWWPRLGFWIIWLLLRLLC